MVAGTDNPEPSTTLWEEWDTYQQGDIMVRGARLSGHEVYGREMTDCPPSRPASAASQNSRNHFMFASVGTWLYQRLVGVMPLAPGYADILIAPQVGLFGVETPHGALQPVSTPSHGYLMPVRLSTTQTSAGCRGAWRRPGDP